MTRPAWWLGRKQRCHARERDCDPVQKLEDRAGLWDGSCQGCADSERDIHADALVIATGSSWPNLPQFPIDGRKIVTSQQMLDLTQVPANLAILGGGVEGCEFAALYSGLGTQVTILELMPRLLPFGG
ncbi:MAG TPA: FAD-dependent oxidoreductase [Nitrospira sp.]|nr:FAD-dependent oxidoreductase [Nitrospira sp.]